MNFSQKYQKYKNKYLELKNLFQIGGAPDPVNERYETEYDATHAVRPFILGERVIVFRSRIAKIISICQNSPEINEGIISYNIYYIDTNPRELKTNISELDLIRLPTDINPGNSRYTILQPKQEVMWGAHKGTVDKIRDNKKECYKVFIPTLALRPGILFPGKECIPREQLRAI